MPSITNKKNAPVNATLWMINGCLWFAVLTAIVRYLSTDVHPFQIVFFRNLFGAPLMLLWVIHLDGIASLKTTKWKAYTIRSTTGVLGMMLWFLALSLLPLPEATALSFTVPLFTTIAAILFLGEVVGKHRWAALIIGFVGAIVIIRPGFEEFNYAYLIVLASTCMWSISNILIKSLSVSEKPRIIVFYLTLIMIPMSLFPALFVWDSMSWENVGWLIGLGLVSNLALASLSNALSLSDVSIIGPFDFSRLIFASIIAYFAFGETLDIWTVVGAAVIVTSSVYIMRREAKANKHYEKDIAPE